MHHNKSTVLKDYNTLKTLSMSAQKATDPMDSSYDLDVHMYCGMFGANFNL